MIEVRIGLGCNEALRSFTASGHSDLAAKGDNIVCAAFTCIARSAAKVLEAEPGVTVDGTAPAPGVLQFDITGCAAERMEWLQGVRDVLIKGIGDLMDEFPDQLHMAIAYEDDKR